MPQLRTINDLPDLRGKFVLLRPGLDMGKSWPVAQRLLESGARVIVLGHCEGAPQAPPAPESFFWYAEQLAILLRRKIVFIEDRDGRLPDYHIPHIFFFRQSILEDKLSPLLSKLQNGDIGVLENLNLYPEERVANKEFASRLAAMGYGYVQDDFAGLVQGYASVTVLPSLIPSVAGESLIRELDILERFRKPKHPCVLLLGGKLTDYKLAVLPKVASVTSRILLGGEFASLFLRLAGYSVGESKPSHKHIAAAKALWRDLKEKIVLPQDLVSSRDKQTAQAIAVDKLKAEDWIMDIGPKSIQAYSSIMKTAKTLIWYGALGVLDERKFSHGTASLAKLFAGRCGKYAHGVIAGDELIKFFAKEQLTPYVDFVCSGGESMLACISGNIPLGLKVLEK